MIELKKVKSETEVTVVADLARIILHEFYHPQMPKAHIDFFISEYQTAEKIEKQIENNFEYYLIYRNVKPIGYLGLETKSDYLVLSKLYILDSERRSNIGAAAIELSKQRLAEQKFNKMELFVNHLNGMAIKFYEKHGFFTIKSVVHTYDSGQSETDILMRFTPDQ